MATTAEAGLPTPRETPEPQSEPQSTPIQPISGQGSNLILTDRDQPANQNPGIPDMLESGPQEYNQPMLYNSEVEPKREFAHPSKEDKLGATKGTSSTNIISGKRARHPGNFVIKPFFVDYSYGDLPHYHSAFATGVQARQPPLEACIHLKDLPPKPKSWKDVQNHPYRTEFIAAVKQEWNTLWNQGTFEESLVTGIPHTSILPLI